MSDHKHHYIYSDFIPGIGECLCGAYRVWNREKQQHEEWEME